MKTDLRNALQLMHGRARAFHSFSPNAARTPNLLADLQALQAPEADALAAAKMIQAAWKDKDKAEELCALRVQQINNYARATTNLSQLLFEEVTLADNEQAAWQNVTQNETTVGMLSQDGVPRQSHVVASQGQTLIDLYALATDEVEYSIKDIYTGDVSAAARATLDLGFDLASELDEKAYTLLTASLVNGGAYGAFDFTNASKHLRTLNLHSRVSADNLPSTNEIKLSSTTAWPYPLKANGTASGNSQKLRFDVPRAAIRYCDRFAGLWPAPLRPTGVIIAPAIDASDFLDEVDPTGSTANPIADALMNNYSQFSFGGINWTIVPDITLPQGICYPVLNKPVGYLYRKPSQDQDVPETNLRKNRETRFLKAVVGMAIPVQNRPFAVRIDYRNT